MRNLKPSDLAGMVNVCQDIALRFVNHKPRQAIVLSIAHFVKYQTRWRQVMYSEDAAQGLWDAIRGTLGEDALDLVISMTGEMVFRLADDIEPANAQSRENDDFYPLLAKSLSWMKNSNAVDVTNKNFTADTATYRKTFENNPWALFLYLLSMSDAVRIINAMDLPDLPAEGGE